ncbi:hypothetical protein DAPPUDRAFT_249968 [Daphnia pulex]|uniref:Uncharacterized protein n=1 Tax=Daphnia pulex TaxID=6669 RepID=E9GXM9_DAPPU|nr:hypothetical protein DAPPUDRAFT_249968 [Daphnia pulex]|eukprot:EFX75787.1 hypothetical protein DAPPUDRAFT_249968 [Daphnia pulex]
MDEREEYLPGRENRRKDKTTATLEQVEMLRDLNSMEQGHLLHQGLVLNRCD